MMKYILFLSLLFAAPAFADTVQSLTYNPQTGFVQALTKQNGTKQIAPTGDVVYVQNTGSLSLSSTNSINPVSFPTTVLNVGGGWNSSTNTYTCKTAGVYLIRTAGTLIKASSSTGITAVTGDVYNLQIKKNGVDVLTYYLEAGGMALSETRAYTRVVLVQLAVGDTIQVSLAYNMAGARTWVGTWNYPDLGITRVY